MTDWESWVYMRVWPLGSPSLSHRLIGTSAKIKDPVVPLRESNSLGKGDRETPPKHTHLHVHMPAHLQVVSTLQSQKRRCSRCISGDVPWPLMPNWCVLCFSLCLYRYPFLLSLFFSPLSSHTISYITLLIRH